MKPKVTTSDTGSTSYRWASGPEIKNIPCFSGACSEIYKEKRIDNTGWRPAVDFPVAKQLGETSLMFLVHPTLTQAEIDKTCSVIALVMKEVTN